ncbi:hypothetical protein [Serratia sp. BFP-2025]|uniref:hypothetical protein n=1 Tax=Serratia sp. BFP-2025 TaxID=3433707 RepID=UPI003D7CBAE7
MAVKIAAVCHPALEAMLVENRQGKRSFAMINRLIFYKVIGKRDPGGSAANHTELIHEISPYSHLTALRTIASGVGIKRRFIPY